MVQSIGPKRGPSSSSKTVERYRRYFSDEGGARVGAGTSDQGGIVWISA